MVNITSTDHVGEIKQLKQKKNIAFEGKRTDRNLVSELTKENGGALFRPKARAIETALKSLSGDSSNENIAFLLDVAKNLKYGVRQNSSLDNFIRTETVIADKKQIQNIDWEGLLKETITKAMANSNNPKKAEFQKEFESIFARPDQKENYDTPSAVWLSVHPTYKQEVELKQVARDILNSAEFTKSTDDKNKAEIKKNLAYFVASSEVALKEKIECLKLAKLMLSDEYKIQPQLESKKIQAVSEIINDLVIKTPEEDQLIIKKMSQRMHGMCAAISTSRKAMAHEHKLQYISNLVAELDAKPTMEIFDPTAPNNTDKMVVEKAQIDYTEALDQGYRIVDAAVCNWMHIADNMGNGQTKAGKYIAWDKEHYGMFQDSHLLSDASPEALPLHNVYRSILKLKDVVEKVEENIADQKEADTKIRHGKLEFTTSVSISRRKVANQLTAALNASGAQVSQEKVHSVANMLIMPEDVKNDSMKIDDREGPKVTKSKLVAIIKDQLPAINDQQIDKIIDKIQTEFSIIKIAREEKGEWADKLTIKSISRYQEKLFEVAAYDRVRREFECEVPEILADYAKEFGVPAEKQAVLKKMEDTGLVLSRSVLDNIEAEFDRIKAYEKLELKKGDAGYLPDTKVYLLPPKMVQTLKSVEDNVNKIRRGVIRDHKDLTKVLGPELEGLYTRNGMSMGKFWVGEEGHSGLHGSQYSRLLKQLSGDDHFITGDPVKALDHIEAGKGGSVTATNVEHYGYSGHAQYVYDVKKEDILNPQTGEVEEQRVLYHDNTWGNRELKHTWKDDGGHLRTDYGSNRGGRQGYLLDPTVTQGTSEQSLLTETGVNKPERMGKGGKKDKSAGTEYAMFNDVILKGQSPTAMESSGRMFNRIIELSNDKSAKETQMLFQMLLQGNVKQIDALAEKLTISLFNSVFEAVRDSSKYSQLAKTIEKNVDEAVKDIPSSVFKSGAVQRMKENLCKQIPETVEKIMNSKQSDDIKEVHVARFVENIARQAAYVETNPGQSLRPKASEGFQKTAKQEVEELTKLIRGKSLIAAGFDKNGPTTKGGIETREDYNALPNNHPIKVITRKIVMHEKAIGDGSWVVIDKARNEADLDVAHNFLMNQNKELLKSAFFKTPQMMSQAVKVFQANAKEALEVAGKETDTDLSSLLGKIEAVSANAPKLADGSVAKIKQQFESIVNDTVNTFNVETGGKENAKAEVLKAKLTEALNNTVKQMNPINNIDDLLKDDVGSLVATWIDTKFDPQSDEDFIRILNDLRNRTAGEFQALVDKSTAKELDLNYSDPFVLTQRIRGLNDEAEEKFRDTIFNHVFNDMYLEKTCYSKVDEVKAKHNEWLKTKEAQSLSPEQRNARLAKQIVSCFKGEELGLDAFYRQLDVQFSYIGIEKFLRGERQKAIEQYGAWPSFPIVRPASEEELVEGTRKNLSQLAGLAVQKNQLKAAEEQYKNDPEALKQIAEQSEQIDKAIKFNKAVMVKGLVRPRHQDDAHRAMNEMIKEVTRNPESDLAQQKLQKLEELMVQDHILNHPDEFLENIAKEVPKMPFNKNKLSTLDNNVVGLWKDALHTCLEASKKALLEFKLMEKIDDGRMPQIAKALRDPEVMSLTTEKSKKSIGLDSKEGIKFLLSTLSDPSNDFSTLKMFLEQTGMVNTAVKYFLEGPSPTKSVTLVKRTADKLEQIKVDQEIVQDKFEEFAAKLFEGDKLDIAGLEKAVNSLFAELDQTFAQKGRANSDYYSNYKNVITESLNVAKQMNAPLPEGDARNLLLGWQDQILANQDSYTEATIERAISQMNLLQQRMQGLSVLDDLVPAFSPLRQGMNSFNVEAEKAVKEIDQIRERLQGPILDKVEAQQKEQQQAQVEAMGKMQSMSQEEMMQMVVSEAQATMQQLLKSINSNDQQMQKQIVNGIINTDNPILDQVLTKTFQEVDHPILKAFCAGILAQKGHVGVLAKYVSQALDQNDQIKRDIQDDQALVLAAEGLIRGTQMQDDKMNNKFANLLGKVFKASCDDKNATPVMDQLLNMFLNALPNQGPVVDKMLIETISNPKEHINSRCVAIDILGRAGSISYFGLFDEIIAKPEKYTMDAAEQLYLLNVAMKSVSGMAEQFKGLPYQRILQNLTPQKIEMITQIAKEQKSYPAEEIDGSAKQLTDRIAIFKDILEGKKVNKQQHAPECSCDEEHGLDDAA